MLRQERFGSGQSPTERAMHMFRGARTYYSREIDEVADHRDAAADACLRERRLTLSMLDELIAAVTFMGVILLLTLFL
jgi:hypothetical protein